VQLVGIGRDAVDIPRVDNPGGGERGGPRRRASLAYAFATHYIEHEAYRCAPCCRLVRGLGTAVRAACLELLAAFAERDGYQVTLTLSVYRGAEGLQEASAGGLSAGVIASAYR
jgi:hypothetical protein